MIQLISSVLKGYTNRYSFETSTNLQTANTIVLVLGNLAFIAAVLVARSAPANGYEVDIYRATPLLFWVGVGVALVSAVWVLSHPSDDISWYAALVLTGISGLSIPALPIIRGYFFYGLTDALNHLGWARELVAGTTTFFSDIYPASHVFSGVLSVLGGTPLERGMLLVVLVLLVSYVVFSVLVIREILPTRTATSVALVAALLFLPVNHVALAPHFHTYSLATFFFPFVLFLFVKHVTSSGPDPTLPRRLSSTDLGVIFGGTAIIVFHPQVAANVIVLLGTVALVQFVARRRYPKTLFAQSKPVYGQFIFLTVVFLAWNIQYNAIFALSTSLTESLIGMLNGTDEAGRQIIADRAESAEGAGTGLVTLFFKIFLSKTVFVLAAAAVVGKRLLSYLSARSSQHESSNAQFGDQAKPTTKSDTVVALFAVSGVSLAVFFVAHYFGGAQGYFFRHAGFGMVLAMVVATVGFVQLGERMKNAGGSLRSAVFVLATVALVVSMAAFFASPYLSLPTGHVSEQQYEGHATTFEYAGDSAAFAALRTGPERYYDARGANLDNRLRWAIYPEDMGPELRDVREHDFPQKDFYYLILTKTDRDRELIAYNGLRFTAEDFDSVPNQEGVSRVYTNGEVESYQVLYSTAETDGPGE
ncbi:hypothetical protein ACH9L7_17390 (plasmid) [Haloferax sp. S1W]|uniref:hypothetical protein n=1 Tax=Haloferax sp. S1W TaxID=3377110 RepID=UPI0037C9E29D